jgi:hypothetical protein
MGENVQRRGAVYWFRRRVPDTIRPVLKLTEITRSLRTVCPKTASERARLAWLATEAAFREMSRIPSLTELQAKLIISQLLDEPLLNSPTADELVDGLARFDQPGIGMSKLLFNTAAVDVIMSLPEDQRQHVAEHMKLIAERAEVWIARMGQAIARDGAEMAKADAAAQATRADNAEAALAQTRLAAEVSGAVNARLAEIVAASRSEPRAAAAAPEAERAEPVFQHPGPRKKQTDAPIFSSFIDGFKAWRLEGGTTHQVLGQEVGTLRRFQEACGDRAVTAYNRGDITDFIGLLRKMPAIYGKRPSDKELTIHQLIMRADAEDAELDRRKKCAHAEDADPDRRKKCDRMTDKTAKRHLSTLSQFFKHAVNRGKMSMAQRAELIDEHGFKSADGARDQRDNWEVDELKTLFSSPVYTGCHAFRRSQPGTDIIRDAKFWLPLLGLHQGGRLEEFADLYGRDIICDEGQWAFKIVPMAADEESGTKERRLKTFAAKRTIPMHPEIIKFGFLDYVRQIAPRPDDPIFPDLEPQGEDGKRGPRFTRWFVEYRRAIEIYREGVAAHAFRHEVIHRLSNVVKDLQQRRHRDYMTGHAAKGTEGDERYDKGPGLKACAETLALLQYPELDLSHLYVSAHPIERRHGPA